MILFKWVLVAMLVLSIIGKLASIQDGPKAPKAWHQAADAVIAMAMIAWAIAVLP